MPYLYPHLGMMLLSYNSHVFVETENYNFNLHIVEKVLLLLTCLICARWNIGWTDLFNFKVCNLRNFSLRVSVLHACLRFFSRASGSINVVAGKSNNPS